MPTIRHDIAEYWVQDFRERPQSNTILLYWPWESKTTLYRDAYVNDSKRHPTWMVRWNVDVSGLNDAMTEDVMNIEFAIGASPIKFRSLPNHTYASSTAYEFAAVRGDQWRWFPSASDTMPFSRDVDRSREDVLTEFDRRFIFPIRDYIIQSAHRHGLGDPQ